MDPLELRMQARNFAVHYVHIVPNALASIVPDSKPLMQRVDFMEISSFNFLHEPLHIALVEAHLHKPCHFWWVDHVPYKKDVILA